MIDSFPVLSFLAVAVYLLRLVRAGCSLSGSICNEEVLCCGMTFWFGLQIHEMFFCKFGLNFLLCLDYVKRIYFYVLLFIGIHARQYYANNLLWNVGFCFVFYLLSLFSFAIVLLLGICSSQLLTPFSELNLFVNQTHVRNNVTSDLSYSGQRDFPSCWSLKTSKDCFADAHGRK